MEGLQYVKKDYEKHYESKDSKETVSQFYCIICHYDDVGDYRNFYHYLGI